MHVERRLIQIATREELLASPPQTQRSPNMVMTIAPFGLAIRSAPSGKDRRIACQNAGLWQNACLTPVHLCVATHVVSAVKPCHDRFGAGQMACMGALYHLPAHRVLETTATRMHACVKQSQRDPSSLLLSLPWHWCSLLYHVGCYRNRDRLQVEDRPAWLQP